MLNLFSAVSQINKPPLLQATCTQEMTKSICVKKSVENQTENVRGMEGKICPSPGTDTELHHVEYMNRSFQCRTSPASLSIRI